MRAIYLTLAFFILTGIGAACRTPTLLPDDCERLSGGLAHCATPQSTQRD
jgi:hypothetical protein